MRALIFGLSVLAVLAIIASANTARAGLSTTPREVASVDPASLPDEANQQTEDQLRSDQGDAPRSATGAGQAWFRYQGQRKVRQADPRCYHALAGRARLSKDRISRHHAAYGAAGRKQRCDRSRQIRSSGASPRRGPYSPCPRYWRSNWCDRRCHRRPARPVDITASGPNSNICIPIWQALLQMSEAFSSLHI